MGLDSDEGNKNEAQIQITTNEQQEADLDKKVSEKFDKFMKQGYREKNMKLYTQMTTNPDMEEKQDKAYIETLSNENINLV